MKKRILTTLLLCILIGGIIAAYLYFQPERTKATPQSVDIPEIKSATALPETTAPETRQRLNAPVEKLALPQLESSDQFMAAALEKLLNNQSLMAIFINDQLINNIVVTIDNLPRNQVTMKFVPIQQAPGQFIVTETEGKQTISLENQARYLQYVKFAESVEPKQLVKLYVQLYPLFQQSYEQLGYPKRYFNDRLMVAIDHLLATPAINEPIALTRPKFFYLYADEDLESRSIGQRILMRIGSVNAQLIKAKLQAIKQALILNMHEHQIAAPVENSRE
jgi:hypothetical protein